MSHEGKKKTFILPQGKGVGERNGYCKSTNKQLSLSIFGNAPGADGLIPQELDTLLGQRTGAHER